MQQSATDKPVARPASENTINSEQLLPDGTLIIRHNNENYCLRVTRNGKLILTK